MKAETITDNEKENLSNPSTNEIETLEDDERKNLKKSLKKNKLSWKILERVHIKRASKIIANMITDRKMESSLS